MIPVGIAHGHRTAYLGGEPAAEDLLRRRFAQERAVSDGVQIDDEREAWQRGRTTPRQRQRQMAQERRLSRSGVPDHGHVQQVSQGMLRSGTLVAGAASPGGVDARLVLEFCEEGSRSLPCPARPPRGEPGEGGCRARPGGRTLSYPECGTEPRVSVSQARYRPSQAASSPTGDSLSGFRLLASAFAPGVTIGLLPGAFAVSCRGFDPFSRLRGPLPGAVGVADAVCSPGLPAPVNRESSLRILTSAGTPRSSAMPAPSRRRSAAAAYRRARRPCQPVR